MRFEKFFFSFFFLVIQIPTKTPSVEIKIRIRCRSNFKIIFINKSTLYSSGLRVANLLHVPVCKKFFLAWCLYLHTIN